MRLLGAASTLAAFLANIVALTGSERRVLYLSIALFLAVVAFCVWVILRVQEAEQTANAANAVATQLEARVSEIEGKLPPAQGD